jgi:hypothetical protein
MKERKGQKGIDSVRSRIAYLDKRVRSGRADVAKAKGRVDHFTVVGKQAVKDWIRADKADKQLAKERAKARARRAVRKRAFWKEVLHDVRDGLEEAIERRNYQRKKLRFLKRARDPEPPATGNNIVTFDGKPSAAWLADDLGKARRAGLWSGYLYSGVRSIALCIALCRAMCGAPSCPGRCGGASSNHACDNCAFPRGAADVTDYYRCESAAVILGLRYTNDLPSDRVHMSQSGH